MSLPIINDLGKWIAAEIRNVLPKSQIGKAMAYSVKRWNELSAYLYDGDLEIDYNLVNNALRPVFLDQTAQKPMFRSKYVFILPIQNRSPNSLYFNNISVITP